MFSHTIAQIIGCGSMFSRAIEGVRKNQPFLRGTEAFPHFVARINCIPVEAIGFFRGLHRDAGHAGISLPGVTSNPEQQRSSRDFISGAGQTAQFDEDRSANQHEQKKYDPAHHSPSLDLRKRPRASHTAASKRKIGAVQSGQVTAEARGGS